MQDLDLQRALPWADVCPVECQLEARAIARNGRRVSGGRRVSHLRPRHIRRDSEADLEPTHVVDAKGAGGIGDDKCLIRPGLEGTVTGQRGRSHVGARVR